MLNTLRQRFILSHVLPLLIIIPLMGIALIYMLETQVLLPSLAREVSDQAILTANLANAQSALWNDAALAQSFVDQIHNRMTERVMLLDASGRLLASSDPADAERQGQPVAQLTLTNVLAGKIDVRTTYSQRLHVEVVDVLVPVLGSGQQVVGIVRLTDQLAGVYERFLRLRYLVVGVLAAGLVLGIMVGWVLALDMERPIRQVTQAVQQLACEQTQTLLPERGPQEIRSLLRASNTLAERLHTLEQNRRQLLANLVHELGHPLGAIHSAIEALERGAAKDAALLQELLAGIDEEVKRLRRLLDDLARLRDQVTGSLELNRQEVALGDWLPPVLAPRRAAAHAKGIRWQVELSPDMPTLDADPIRLAQAVDNLVNNAIKYTPADGAVSISTGIEDHEAWIQVSDTGPGIPPEEQAHIFTPFYRGSANNHSNDGMGLGLSIARDLVVAHGGRLEMKSTPGQGSHFTIWLPLAYQEN